jgi:hypothetical protein
VLNSRRGTGWPQKKKLVVEGYYYITVIFSFLESSSINSWKNKFSIKNIIVKCYVPHSDEIEGEFFLDTVVH